MASDPYDLLGVSRSASVQDIRTAYRRLAKRYHPDRNPGDLAAEERFKNISAAFDILGDTTRRQKFDRGDIDAAGNERAAAFARGSDGHRYHHNTPHAGHHDVKHDFGDIFSDLFGGNVRGHRRQHKTAARGRDVRYRMDVTLLDAARGGTKRLRIVDGRELDVIIPEGVRDGQSLRLRGRGEAGVAGGPAGDIYVDVVVLVHKYFQLDGDDLRMEVPVSLHEAVLGGKMTIPTLTNTVVITIPPNTSSGTTLRLNGKGLRNPKTKKYGDLLVRTKIVLPARDNQDLKHFLRTHRDDDFDPRHDFSF